MFSLQGARNVINYTDIQSIQVELKQQPTHVYLPSSLNMRKLTLFLEHFNPKTRKDFCGLHVISHKI